MNFQGTIAIGITGHQLGLDIGCRPNRQNNQELDRRQAGACRAAIMHRLGFLYATQEHDLQRVELTGSSRTSQGWRL